ncbi:MAG: alanine--tRNA ligase, partial [Dehalococcoidia bacterium]
FKPYFLGREQPPALRLTSVQRCFRTTDIEAVGDPTHQTFFEMLGNFSVGDYFKAEAIPWAWEFVTGVLGIPQERLWNTVYLDDDTAFDLWLAQGQRADRIIRYGEEVGNYWFSGDVGPCGPCSEIYYDFGEETGCRQPDCQPSHDCGRFLEIWNIVFMAYNQHEDGTKTDLPKPNIDTGAGLERIASVLQHVGSGIASDYETDLLRPLVEEAARLGERRYGDDEGADLACRIIADHSRALAFLLADGVMPANEGRGYVLRRLLRRTVYFGRRAGLPQGALVRMAQSVVERMGANYPYLRDQEPLVTSVVGQEERRFHETLERGVQRLDEMLEHIDRSTGVFPGEDAFRLYDTYGLPKELTDEIVALNGLRVDDAGYEDAMERQREQARARAEFSAAPLTEDSLFSALGVATPFVGYDRLRDQAEVVSVGREASRVGRLEAGDRGWVVLSRTPFYPEGGGQVGDRGVIAGHTGSFTVEDTQRREGGVIVHYGLVKEGLLAEGATIDAVVDPVWRRDSMRNHTGTHLLQAALRDVLGPHAHQSGSLVAPERLRFDFTHGQQTTAEQLLAVERLVNEVVRDDDAVQADESSYDEALERGALAFFGEKYGDVVRVVTIAGENERPFSQELCGGTHVGHTGQIGLMRIVSEGGIGAGIRRVEALTGRAAEQWVQQQASLVERIAAQLGTKPASLEQRVASLLADLEAERRRSVALQRERGRVQVERLVSQAERRDGASFLVAQVEADNAKALREMGDLLRDRLRSVAVVLACVIDGRPQFVVQVTPDLVQKGINAGLLIGRLALATGGKGGGRPEAAQSGGLDPAKLPEALGLARQLLSDEFT